MRKQYGATVSKTLVLNGSRIKEVMKIPNLKMRKAFSLFLLIRLLSVSFLFNFLCGGFLFISL
jgi:hypothetical protein